MAEPGTLRPVLLRLLEGRVGSTLVMQLLGTSPEVAFERVYPYEHSYLTYLTRLVGQIAAPRPPAADMVEFLYGSADRVGALPFTAQGLDCAALARDSLHGVWQAFSRALPAPPAGPARLYAEKYWGDIMAVVDAGLDPIVIDLVRDPRDVVASVRAFNAQRGRQLFGRAQVRDDRSHLRRILIGMSLRLEEFATPLPVSRTVIRYEDLVTDPGAVTAQLASLLDATFDVEAVSAAGPESARHMTSASPESSVGRWVRDLSSQEIAAVERSLGKPMARLGYALSTGS